MGGGERLVQGLVGKSEGKRPLGRPRRGWDDNIIMDLQELGYGDMDRIEPTQDRKSWRAVVILVRQRCAEGFNSSNKK
jgi:hypothetical protein